MAKSTEISWCDSTFNPWIGCSKISIGCDSCYAAARMDIRLHRVQWGAGQPRVRTKTWGEPVKWNAQEFFECTSCGRRGTRTELEGTDERDCDCHRYLQAARRRVFCASLADVFDNEVAPEWRVDLFRLIRDTPNLDYLLLTKRIGNVRGMMQTVCDEVFPFEPLLMPLNVWLGATVVNQEEADRDIPKLLAVPAQVRFLSMEPLLGPVDLTNVAPPKVEGREWHGIDVLTPANRELRGCIDWVIAGGESGHGARPAHPAWFRSLRDQCASAGVAFHFKQWGEWIGAGQQYPGRDGGEFAHIREFGYDEENRHRLHRIGKKAAGRLLDGVEHNQFPEVAP